jgi:zinc protease
MIVVRGNRGGRGSWYSLSRLPRITITTLLLAFLAITTAAQAAEVKEVVSDSGIKAWLIEEHALPLVAVRVAFPGSGFAYDPSGEEGLANMVAAMLTEGAGDMNEREWNEALENKAIEFNTAVNEDMLEVSMQSLAEHKDAAFSMLGLALSKPRFDSEAVERTRRQMQAILKQSEQNPGYQLDRAWKKLAFGEHPYGKPQIGTERSIGGIGGSDLRGYAEDYLTRGNMLVAVVGDITSAELKTMLDKHFTDLPKKYDPDITVAEAKINTADKPVVVPYDIPQTQVAFALSGIKREDPDYIAAYVMNQILGGNGNLVSRLGQEIREKRGLSYYVYSHFAPLSHGGVWEGGFATRNEQARQATAVLRDTLEQFVKNGPSDSELANAKYYLTGSFAAKLDTNEALAAFLINMQHNKLGIDYLDKRNDLIKAVDKKDIEVVAKRLINPDKLLIVMIGKPGA